MKNRSKLGSGLHILGRGIKKRAVISMCHKPKTPRNPFSILGIEPLKAVVLTANDYRLEWHGHYVIFVLTLFGFFAN